MKKVLIANQILIFKNTGNDRGQFWRIDTVIKGTEPSVSCIEEVGIV